MHRLIVSAAVLITLVGTAARAEEGTMRVRLGDLNIREEAGAQAERQQKRQNCGSSGWAA